MQHGVNERTHSPPLHSATEKKREREREREGEHSERSRKGEGRVLEADSKERNERGRREEKKIS